MLTLQVIWKQLFAPSSRDHGTMSQFCSLLGRLPAAKDPKKDMNACTDILMTVLKGHYIAAASNMLGISSLDEIPKSLPDFKKASVAEKKAFLYDLADRVVQCCSLIEEPFLGREIADAGDGVYNYARVLCHFASLALEFLDSWAEGDGERIIRCWRVFLLHFYTGGRTKYSWEALRLQFQLVFLPPTISHQLKWNRFINTHGGLGRNIPCDLHNEHMNKLFKEIVKNMGPNLTEQAVMRAARSVTALQDMSAAFDKQCNVPVGTSAHSRRNDEHDVGQVASVVQRMEALHVKPGRNHSCFRKMKLNPLSKFKEKEFLQWVTKKKKQMVKFRVVRGEGNTSDSDATDDQEDSDEHEHTS